MIGISGVNGYQSNESVLIIIHSSTFGNICLLLFHGLLAFFLNIANFNAVREGGPLMMNVVGNVKQVVMIILFVYIGVVGSVICITGSFWYSYGKDDK